MKRALMWMAVLVVVSGTPACPHAQSPLVDGGGVGAAPDEALFQDALTLYDARDFARAQAKFDELVDAFPTSRRHDNAGYLAGRCRYEQGLDDEAIVTLLAMRAAHPDSPYFSSACYFTGRARFHLAQWADSVLDFQTALDADPTATYADNAAYYVGRAAYEGGQLAAAATALLTFETDYPQSSYVDNGRYYLGRSYFDRQLYDDALAPFLRVFESDASPFADNARYYIGRSEYALVRLDDALSSFADVVVSYPDSQYVDNALYYEVRVHVDQANCAAAQTALDALSAQFPGSPELPLAQNYFAGPC